MNDFIPSELIDWNCKTKVSFCKRSVLESHDLWEDVHQKIVEYQKIIVRSSVSRNYLAFRLFMTLDLNEIFRRVEKEQRISVDSLWSLVFRADISGHRHTIVLEIQR